MTAATGDGSFQYNPAPGFTGATLSPTRRPTPQAAALHSDRNSDVNNMIWFVDAAAAAGGDGRLTIPLTASSAPALCFSTTAADDPGDNIFLYAGTYPDTGLLTLLNNQKLLGQGASGTLAGIAGVVVPPHSDALPTLNSDPAYRHRHLDCRRRLTSGQNTLRGLRSGTRRARRSVTQPCLQAAALAR